MPSSTALLLTPPSSAAIWEMRENSPALVARALAFTISADGGAFHRNRHHEHGAAGLIRGDANRAVVPVHQAFHDGQAQARPAGLARAARVDLIEGVEHSAALALRNADAGVGDANLYGGAA